MGSLFLVHWDAAEAENLATLLRRGGWEVATESSDGGRAVKAIRANPPVAVVIDLTRLPSHGRATAEGLRALKATRALPLVFVDGSEEAVQKAKAKVPDATFTTSAELPVVIARVAKPAEG